MTRRNGLQYANIDHLVNERPDQVTDGSDIIDGTRLLDLSSSPTVAAIRPHILAYQHTVT